MNSCDKPINANYLTLRIQRRTLGGTVQTTCSESSGKNHSFLISRRNCIDCWRLPDEMRRTSLRQKAITHRLPNKGTLEHGQKCDSKRAEHCPSACSFGSRALGVLSSACPLCGINNSTWFCGFHSKGEGPGRKKSKKAVFWWKASPGIQASLSLISALVSNSHKWDSLLTQQVRCLSIRVAGIV